MPPLHQVLAGQTIWLSAVNFQEKFVFWVSWLLEMWARWMTKLKIRRLFSVLLDHSSIVKRNSSNAVSKFRASKKTVLTKCSVKLRSWLQIQFLTSIQNCRVPMQKCVAGKNNTFALCQKAVLKKVYNPPFTCVHLMQDFMFILSCAMFCSAHFTLYHSIGMCSLQWCMRNVIGWNAKLKPRRDKLGLLSYEEQDDVRSCFK